MASSDGGGASMRALAEALVIDLLFGRVGLVAWFAVDAVVAIVLLLCVRAVAAARASRAPDGRTGERLTV